MYINNFTNNIIYNLLKRPIFAHLDAQILKVIQNSTTAGLKD